MKDRVITIEIRVHATFEEAGFIQEAAEQAAQMKAMEYGLSVAMSSKSVTKEGER